MIIEGADQTAQREPTATAASTALAYGDNT